MNQQIKDIQKSARRKAIMETIIPPSLAQKYCIIKNYDDAKIQITQK